MNNIMIDIETLGKKRGCPVLSIAAVQFDLQTGNVGETFYERMSCDAALSYGWPEISTLEWWSKQSDEARDAAFKGERHPVSVAVELRAFLQRAGGGRCIPWGNGSVFDITILEGWFDKVDPLVDAKGDDIYPWKFWDIADLRTLVRLSGINVKAIPFAGEKHNALADALHQVKIAHAAYSALTSSGRSANREAQPVMWVMSDDLMDEKIISTPAYPNRSEAEERTIGELTPLYTASLAPAYPERLPCPVRLIPGLLFGQGVPTASMLEALKRREEYEAELEAMTPEQKAEDDAKIEAFKALLPQPPAPAVPDEIGVQEAKELFNYLMTEEELNATVNGYNACRAAMLARERSNGGHDGKISD